MEVSKKRMNNKGQLSFLKLIIGGLLVGMFAVGMFSLSSNLADNHGSSLTVLDNPRINESYSQIETELNSSYNTIDAQREGFFNDIPILGAIEAVVGAIFGVLPKLLGIIVSMFDLILILAETTLGIPPLLTGFFTAILLVTAILLAWRVYKSGE